jgi:acetoacetate decarboxylase
VITLYTHPFSKSGNSQIVPPPPYYYGVEYLAAHVFFNKEKLKEILPSFLDTDGEGWIYVADFVTISNDKWNLMYEDPSFTQYKEAAIGLKIYFEGKNYLYFPFMWVDKDWALVRGWVNGYPKKIGTVYLTKLSKLLPDYNSRRENLILGGYLLRDSKLIDLKVTLRRKVTEIPLSKFGKTLTIRYFPKTGENEQEVSELVTVEKVDSKIDDIWEGDAEVQIKGGINDELQYFEIEKVMAGYSYDYYFKTVGTKLVKVIENNSF